MPTPVTAVALWYGEGLVDHLQSIFESILAVMGESVDFVIVTDDPASVQSVAARTECEVIPIPLFQMCSGLGDLLVTRLKAEEDLVVLPSSSGASITFDPWDVNWIEEEIELVHMSIGMVRDNERDVGRDFPEGQGDNVARTWPSLRR